MDKDDLKHEKRKAVYIHFPKTLILSLGLFAGCVALLFFGLGWYSPQDEISYQQLVSGDSATTQATTRSVQNRTGLQKNIFFSDNGQPLELLLKSDQAELVLEKHEGHAEVVEQMQDVLCWMQEHVYIVLPDGRRAVTQEGEERLLLEGSDPKEMTSWIAKNDPVLKREQVIVFLKAQTATYHYKEQVFTAENVNVSRYLLPGDHLQQDFSHAQLLTDGVAAKVVFSLAGKGLNFQADHLKAKFSTKAAIR